MSYPGIMTYINFLLRPPLEEEFIVRVSKAILQATVSKMVQGWPVHRVISRPNSYHSCDVGKLAYFSILQYTKLSCIGKIIKFYIFEDIINSYLCILTQLNLVQLAILMDTRFFAEPFNHLFLIQPFIPLTAHMKLTAYSKT
ncbi:hypothetical protein DOT_1808 [Desulfosporosinus sp. OT]|nr:hypothetical protein DOT_1808 [Desulfosporosinus sp. OT]